MKRLCYLSSCFVVAAVLNVISIPLNAQLLGAGRSGGEDLIALSEHRDPAFERYVDTQLLQLALTLRDASLLVDVGLQLAEGERILLRSHSAASAREVLAAGLELAASQGNQPVLTRIKKYAEQQGNQELLARTTAAARLGASSRTTSDRWQAIVKQASPELIPALTELPQRLQTAVISGDRELIELFAQTVDKQKTFSDEQKRLLKEEIKAALEELQRTESEASALRALLGDSRTSPGLWRVAGADERFSLFPGGAATDAFGPYVRYDFYYEGLIIRGKGSLLFYHLTGLVRGLATNQAKFLGAELRPEGVAVTGIWNPAAPNTFTMNWTLDGRGPITFVK